MKLTQKWFKQQRIPTPILNWAYEQFSENIKELDATEIINRLITQEKEITEHYKNEKSSENSLDWGNCIICKVLSKEQKIKYAIFAAEQVLDIYEKQYPEDKRPRNAINTAKIYLENSLTAYNANTIYNAASGAHIAANKASCSIYNATNGTYAAATVSATASAAASAAYAADSTAYAAANNYTNSSYAAAAAATNAAHAANAAYAAYIAANSAPNNPTANNAAANEMKKHILEYGLNLLQQ